MSSYEASNGITVTELDGIPAVTIPGGNPGTGQALVKNIFRAIREALPNSVHDNALTS